MPDKQMAIKQKELKTAPDFESNGQETQNLRPPETRHSHEKHTDSEKPQLPSNEGSQEGFLDQTIEELKKKLRKPNKRSKAMPNIRDELTLKIEHVMEEGLKDAYMEMTEIQKQEFKIKGEETAYKIRNLMRGAHVKVKKIFQLLLEWLKMLPGINKFFLEQEAKIKADKIAALKHFDKFK